MKNAVSAALLGAGISLLAMNLAMNTASAQSRFVTFGDSLSDPGNLYAVTGRTQPASPPYVNGHFSNGLTWIEQITGAPVMFVAPLSNTASVNYAFGGARTDTAVSNPPGIPAQIAAYLSRGGKFGAQDQVTIWGGANNIFQELGRATEGGVVTQATITAVSTAAAADIATAARTAAAAGARNFVILNLPDLGMTPQFLGTAGQSGATLASATFNNTLANQLAALKAANPGLNIVMVDTAALFAQLTANPAAFGFSNASTACTSSLACIAATRAVQNAFAFYDPVHPTTAGHALIAALVNAYLNAGTTAGWAAPMADAQWSQREDNAQRALLRHDQIALGLAPADNYYAEAIGSALQQGGGAGSAFSSRAGGLAAGITRALTPNWQLGGAISGQTGRFSAQGTSGDLTNVGLDLVAQYTQGMWFARGGLGVSGGSFNGLSRTTLGGLTNTSDADAYALSAIAEAGIWQRFGAFAVSPRARFGWLGTSIDGFQETGVVAPLSFGSRQAGTFLAAAEILGAYTISNGPKGPLVVQASVGYEGWFGSNGYGVDAVLAANFGTALAVPGTASTGPGFIYSLGIAGPIGESLKLGFDFRGSVGEQSRHAEIARLTLTGAF